MTTSYELPNNNNADSDAALEDKVDDSDEAIVMCCQYFPIKGAA